MRAKNIAIRLTAKDYDKILELVQEGEYATVTDFIRTAVRELLRRHEK